MINRVIISLLIGSIAWPAFALDVSEYRLVDLSHSYNDDTLYWPTPPSRFEKQQVAFGRTDGGWFYSAFSICTPEHGGTHLDAPQHFAARGITTDKIPLENLIAAAVVIDVTKQAEDDRDYRLTVDDVLDFERDYGEIEPGSIVLLRTGWGALWPDRKAYLGDDTPGDASNLRFPSYGRDAAWFLIEERNVGVLGVDMASIDYGQSTDFLVHRIAAKRNVPGIENVANLDLLPPRGAIVIALPIKIEGGSGGPVRIVALLPK